MTRVFVLPPINDSVLLTLCICLSGQSPTYNVDITCGIRFNWQKIKMIFKFVKVFRRFAEFETVQITKSKKLTHNIQIIIYGGDGGGNAHELQSKSPSVAQYYKRCVLSESVYHCEAHRKFQKHYQVTIRICIRLFCPNIFIFIYSQYNRGQGPWSKFGQTSKVFIVHCHRKLNQAQHTAYTSYGLTRWTAGP